MRTIFAAALGSALMLSGGAIAQTGGATSPTDTTPGIGTGSSPGTDAGAGVGTPGTAATEQAAPQIGDTSPGAAMGQPSPGLGTDTTADTATGMPQLGMTDEDARAVIGKQLRDSQGEEVGEIANVLIGQDGRVQALVVDHEGDKKRLDWQRVTMTQEGDIETTAEVAELPDFEEDEDTAQ